MEATDAPDDSLVHDEETAAHERGRSSGSVIFRDPPPVDDEAARLRSEIARILVRAPSLPIELPRFRLTLIDVVAHRRGIDLLIGKTAPIAHLRIEKASSADGLRELGTPSGARSHVSVTVKEVHHDAQRFSNELRVMADRLRAAITQEAWETATVASKALLKLPSGVPVGFYRQMVLGIREPQGLVRTGFLCNQDCGICWQSRDWGRHGPEQILLWIEDLHAAGARRLIISGGEPTLDSQLSVYVQHARRLGYEEVTLETNAIQFSRPGLAETLRDAGVTSCFVSLHSGNEAVSDALTRAPGTFKRTIAGIQNLLDASVPVILNSVMTNDCLDDLPAFPDFIDRTFAKHPMLKALMLSLPSDAFDSSLNASISPDPEKMRRVLPQTIDRAFELGLVVRGLDGPCGPPLCAFGADPRIVSLEPIAEDVNFRMYLPACDGCAVKHACFGVRSVQVEQYGDACVKPLPRSQAQS